MSSGISVISSSSRVPPLRALEHARMRARRAREAALLVTEQLGLDQRRRNCPAVDRDERDRGARAACVQRLGHQFLARPALAADQHRRIGRCDPPDQPAHIGQGGTGADQRSVDGKRRLRLLACAPRRRLLRRERGPEVARRPACVPAAAHRAASPVRHRSGAGRRRPRCIRPLRWRCRGQFALQGSDVCVHGRRFQRVRGPRTGQALGRCSMGHRPGRCRSVESQRHVGPCRLHAPGLRLLA